MKVGVLAGDRLCVLGSSHNFRTKNGEVTKPTRSLDVASVSVSPIRYQQQFPFPFKFKPTQFGRKRVVGLTLRRSDMKHFLSRASRHLPSAAAGRHTRFGRDRPVVGAVATVFSNRTVVSNAGQAGSSAVRTTQYQRHRSVAFSGHLLPPVERLLKPVLFVFGYRRTAGSESGHQRTNGRVKLSNAHDVLAGVFGVPTVGRDLAVSTQLAEILSEDNLADHRSTKEHRSESRGGREHHRGQRDSAWMDSSSVSPVCTGDRPRR